MADSGRARALRAVGLGLITGALALSVAAGALVRSSFPRTQGLVTLPGLQAAVDVYRTADGVPHVFASNEHDLFFAQGYLHAQDRFWQMDFFRHVGAGRLAEMFGPSQVETDAFLRTLGWERLAQRETETLAPETMAILEAYADGVNAYLHDRRGARVSLEYAVLWPLNPAYQIEPWTPVHTLTWAKAMAWDLGGNMDGEIDRTMLLASLSPDRLADLYPPYPPDHPVIVPTDGDRAQRRQPVAPAFDPEVLEDLARLQDRAAAADDLLAGGFPGVGSNSWVIGGARTASGAPILANDTHLGIQMPSIWYENGLHCRGRTPDCRFNVAGFSFAGVPAVVLGHNDRIAWGATNAGPDVQDLFIEQLNPDDPDQYLFEGEWREMRIREERIQVAGADSIPLTIRETHHGPIISETYEPLDELRETTELAPGGQYAVALRWTALEPSTLIEAVIAVNLAQDWESFRQAARSWDVPSQNLSYADVDGNIGYQLPGKIPRRASGDGWLPAEGWTGEAEWRDFIPFDQLPHLLNPAQGYLVTANHAIVDESYPYFLQRDWDRGYRADRISTLIEAAKGVTVEDVRAMQGDDLNPMAAVLIPKLSLVELDDPKLEGRRRRLQAWDGQDRLDSAEAALFNAFWRQVLDQTFADEWEAGPAPTDSRAFAGMTLLLEDPDSPWWDLPTTEPVEDQEALLRLAFEAANDELEATLGPSMEDWRWGDLHTATFENQSLGQSGIAPIEALFNRGPFAVSGGSSIVNATDWDPGEGYMVESLPSQRLILDLSDWDAAQTIHTTGQSGHAFHPNYIDQAERWRTVQTHPLLWAPAAIVRSATAHLRLTPASGG